MLYSCGFLGLICPTAPFVGSFGTYFGFCVFAIVAALVEEFKFLCLGGGGFGGEDPRSRGVFGFKLSESMPSPLRRGSEFTTEARKYYNKIA